MLHVLRILVPAQLEGFRVSQLDSVLTHSFHLHFLCGSLPDDFCRGLPYQTSRENIQLQCIVWYY